MKHELYTWQQEAIDAWTNKNCKGTVMAPTGSGKTRVATEIIKEWLKEAMILNQEYGIVVIVPTVRLMDQWYHDLLDIGIDRVGRYGGKNRDRHLNVIVCVINSARKLQLTNENTLLICDEAHRMATEGNKSIFRQITYSAILGLSATPDRADGLDVTKFTGELVYRLGYKQAVDDGGIPAFTVNIIETKLSLVERIEYQQHTKSIATFVSKLQEAWGSNVNPMTMSPELDENIVFFKAATQARKRAVNSSEERFDVLDYLLNLHKGEKIAVFHESINDIEKLSKHYREENYSIDVYHSDTEGGDSQFKQWCNSIPDEGRILFTCKALKEGINVPSMQVVIMLSGTNDARSRIQTLGRALRGTAATTYLMYAINTTDKNGWEQMVEVGQIPMEFVIEHKWTGSSIKRLTPLKVSPPKEQLKDDFIFALPEGWVSSEDEEDFSFILPENYAHSKIDNRETQIMVCAQPVHLDQNKEMIE